MWRRQTRAVVLNFSLPRGTFGQLYNYLAASLYAKIDLKFRKSDSCRHPLQCLTGALMCRGKPVENHWTKLINDVHSKVMNHPVIFLHCLCANLCRRRGKATNRGICSHTFDFDESEHQQPWLPFGLFEIFCQKQNDLSILPFLGLFECWRA